jgi:hypothetical protein
MAKRSGMTGLAVNVIGWVLVLVGIPLCFTFIGACVGIPMILAGIPMMVFGWMSYVKARSARIDSVLQQAVAEGVRQQVVQASQAPQVKPAKTCKACGAAMDVGQNFCPSCGLDQR